MPEHSKTLCLSFPSAFKSLLCFVGDLSTYDMDISSAESLNVIYLPQAAEKALKAAQYTLHAEKTNDHNLVWICNGLNDAELANFASQLQRLVGSSARMRYPDCFTCPQIPHEVYSSQQARESLHLATEIVTLVKPRIENLLRDRMRKREISM